MLPTWIRTVIRTVLRCPYRTTHFVGVRPDTLAPHGSFHSLAAIGSVRRTRKAHRLCRSGASATRRSQSGGIFGSVPGLAEVAALFGSPFGMPQHRRRSWIQTGSSHAPLRHRRMLQRAHMSDVSRTHTWGGCAGVGQPRSRRALWSPDWGTSHTTAGPAWVDDVAPRGACLTRSREEKKRRSPDFVSSPSRRRVRPVDR